MKIHHLTVQEALKSLQSGVDGLSGPEARRRFMEFGPNQVERVKKEPLAFQFLRGFTHFFALILWVAAGLAFFAEWNDPGKGMAALGLAILGVILVNALFSFTQEFRAERAISALQKLLPHLVKALRDRKVVQIPAAELVPGDLILLEQGDNIPADCRLVQGFGVRVNNATITGESLPKARDEHPSTEEDLTQSKNVLLAGTSLVSGETKALVFATGMHTEFGKIAHLTQTAGEALSPLQKEVILLSRMVALLATALGVIFFFIGRALGLSFWENFIFAIGIIVANVPEGLLPTLTLALAMGSQRMARRNALIRHLPSVETLGSATVICTDKTGTLTQNRMAVKRIYLSDQLYHPAELYQDAHLKEDYRFFFEVALFCQDLKTVVKQGREELLGDPMELSLVEMAKKVIPGVEEYPRVDEIPFDSDRKRLSTLHNTPRGLMLYTKGALEMLLPLCHQVQMGVEVRPLTSGLKEQFLKAQESMAEEGLRVLAFAHRAIPEGYDLLRLEENLILSALVGLEDPPRPEVLEAIQKCKGAGIKVIMVTGDHPHTARAIAREIGLVRSPTPVIVRGEELRRISDTQLQLALDAPEIIFARVGADQKMRIVSALKRKGEIVAVTGDGVNDAPALRQADIGIAMGITGTDVAREAADMVLMDDNFASIVSAVEEGRAVFANIRKFLTYILTSNVPEIVPYLAFVLFKIPLPLTIIQILAVDLGTDMLPALALGAEKPEPQVMQRPPRSPKERLWNWSLIARAYLFLGVMESVAAMAAFFFVLHGGGWQYGQDLGRNELLYLQATTACLSAIIIMQVVNVFLCRSDRESAFSFGLFSNKLILWGIITEVVLILLIDYTPWGNLIFGTAPISKGAWLFVIPFAMGMLILEELRKWFLRRSLSTG
ncbi:MAG TPA: cation-transporting P-type ATPase [Nitrospiria bacterium]|nr:cation-transporting P-type ATPase [Nitrospiria bacterium]